jgi:hypothetical protein
LAEYRYWAVREVLGGPPTVLSTLMCRAATPDDPELSLEPVVRRRRGQWRPREEVPGLRHRVADRRDEVAPSLLRVGCGEASSYSIFFGGRGTSSPSWRPPRLRTLHGLIVVEPLQTGAAAAEPGHIHTGETAVEQIRAIWIPFSLCLRRPTSAGRPATTQFATACRSSDHTPSSGFNTGV